MDLHTFACDLLCCEHPVVLAGMGGVARSALVAAVTEAGGFGFLGMVREPPELIRSEIAAVRARTSRPFGVNLIPAATAPDLLEAELAACIDSEVFAVALFWELSAPVVRRLRNEGILVVCQVGSAAEAVAAERAGANLLIAQGWEAGGHVRGLTGLLPLLADIVSAVRIPVLAAGGIVDGAGLAAVMTRGAQGAVIGTGFIATEESFAHDYHKRRIVDAKPDETLHTDIFHINWPRGAAVRVLPNSVTRGERGDPFSGKREIIGAEGERPIYLFSTDSPLQSMTGDFEAMALYAGQGAGHIANIVPAGERLRAIVSEAKGALRSIEREGGQDAVPHASETSSPVCYAGEASDAYMGYATPDEIADELKGLLSIKRLHARLAARVMVDAADETIRSEAYAAYAAEARAARIIAAALARLGHEYEERAFGALPSIEHADVLRTARKDGERATTQRVAALLPRIRDDRLHAMLRPLAEVS